MRTGSALLVVLLTLAGCVDGGEPNGSAMSGADGTTTGEPGTASQTSQTPTTGEPTTGEVAGECLLWEQDCPAGAKCVPFDSEFGDGVIDSSRCADLAELPKMLGDPCSTEGGVLGLDDCDEGLLCWFLDVDGNGRCTPMCTGTKESPKCDGGLVCDVSNGGYLPLCLATCDPLAPTCAVGQICIWSGAQALFVCDGDASGDDGAFGDPCEYINVCDSGLTCAVAENVPGCLGQGCCTEFCDVSMPSDGQCSAPEQECLAWFDEIEPTPGLENVGFCGIKQ
jgi:hypothetical protein